MRVRYIGPVVPQDLSAPPGIRPLAPGMTGSVVLDRGLSVVVDWDESLTCEHPYGDVTVVGPE